MEQFLTEHPWLVALMIIWSLLWKGTALWKAAHFNDKLWFIALLLINTLGLLEILYIFGFSRRKKSTDQD
jgi:hypothetical protein